VIGPATRKHFYKALALAGEAERNLHPGRLMHYALVPLVTAVIEIIRGVAFVMLSDEVEIKVKEASDEPE
jgi:hypothetical protein